MGSAIPRSSPNLRKSASLHINAVAQAGAIAALDDERHAARTRANNSRGLRFYAREFKRLGLSYVPSFGNFVLVKVGEGARVFNEMQKLGVIVRRWGDIRFQNGYDLGRNACGEYTLYRGAQNGARSARWS